MPLWLLSDLCTVYGYLAISLALGAQLYCPWHPEEKLVEVDFGSSERRHTFDIPENKLKGGQGGHNESGLQYFTPEPYVAGMKSQSKKVRERREGSRQGGRKQSEREISWFYI
jgi:hypothetical protein